LSHYIVSHFGNMKFVTDTARKVAKRINEQEIKTRFMFL